MPKNIDPKSQFAFPESEKITVNKFTLKDPGFYSRHPEFSFKYYDHAHKEYSVICIGSHKDFHTMFERLKSMSQFKWKQIRAWTDTYHFHPVEWKESSEPGGFNKLPSNLRDFPAWQFKLYRECRAVGFFNPDNIFEVVWIDSKHKVYKRK